MASPKKKSVRPTGTYPLDLTKVQDAIDEVADGGTVLLRSKDEAGNAQYFHFGDDVTGRGGINVQKDVRIVGEEMENTAFLFPNGKTPDAALTPDRTVIYGGHRPFHCEKLNRLATGLTVRHLYFAYPSQSAVQVKKSSGLEVSNCVIYDLKRDVARRDESGKPTFVVAVGIEATGLGQEAGSIELNGEFNVFDNVVRRIKDGDYGRADSGIVVQLARMTTHIRNNTVSNFGFVGVGVDANESKAVVEKNEILFCGYGSIELPESPASAGIGVRRMSGISGKTTIRDNTIMCGAGPMAPLTSKNGISLVGASGVDVRSNAIIGTASAAGILLTNFDRGKATEQHSTDNSVEKNDLKGLVAGRAQEFIDEDCSSIISNQNEFGPVDSGQPGAAGIVIHSNGNHVTKETFFGDYLGVSGSPRIPWVWLAAGTNGNTVEGIKRSSGFLSLDFSTQIRDEGSNNIVDLKKPVPA